MGKSVSRGDAYDVCAVAAHLTEDATEGGYAWDATWYFLKTLGKLDLYETPGV